MTIHKAGVCIVREKRLLLCRKGKHWILPGGKIEPGETALACAIREMAEEIAGATATGFTFLGAFEDEAASPPGARIRLELLEAMLDGDPRPASEIEALRWFAAGEDPQDLAPSLVRQILPFLIQRGLL